MRTSKSSSGQEIPDVCGRGSECVKASETGGFECHSCRLLFLRYIGGVVAQCNEKRRYVDRDGG